MRDVHGIYGGDSGASKAAKQEIRSLEALVGLNVADMYFPLMALVDHLGVRVVCTSVIPGVSGATLYYGTANALQTSNASHPRLNAKMTHIAKRCVH